MAARRIPEPDNSLNAVHEKLGELTGTMREMNHNLANQAAKVDAIGEKMSIVAALTGRVTLLEENDRDRSARLAVLEADKNRREGAIGLVAWISRHWPITILVAFVTAVWAALTGKVNL